MDSRKPIALILATEWLVLLASLLVGLVVLSIVHPQDSERYLAHRRTLYDKLTKEYQSLQYRDIFDRLPSSRFDPSRAKKLDSFLPDLPPAPPPKPYGSFEQFSETLNNPTNRRAFYDSVS